MIILDQQIAKEIETQLKNSNWVQLLESHEFLTKNKELVSSFIDEPKLLSISTATLTEALFFGYKTNV